jgi:hypothetical protein
MCYVGQLRSEFNVRYIPNAALKALPCRHDSVISNTMSLQPMSHGPRSACRAPEGSHT